MKYFVFPFFVLLTLELQAQSVLRGRLTDYFLQEPMTFCNVSVYKNGSLEVQVHTDLEGYYSVTELDPGNYDVLFESTGFNLELLHNARITTGSLYPLDFELTPGTGLEKFDTYLSSYPPVYQPFALTSSHFLFPNDMKKLPFR